MGEPEASDQSAEAAVPDGRPELTSEAQPARGSTDLEWLFDRRESGPPGWSGAPTPSGAADSTSELRPDGDPAVQDDLAATSGATVVAGRGPRSPWPLLGAFLVVLLLLMLLAYLGGMAFSTIMNR